ncbi:DUF2208 domain-containing protein [Ignicoccus hospitalis]|uniref:Membrane protein-like protein n=1 Tax=Ignicoccus hospitalis (strain KIN4/I / DSM 18386 / JCM 14125) TaxID=453591 RepID=A8AAZ6_IGNH4|nr:DUF2208 domain-containing protein [Ignicoccus hospitalis]ABU82098.1 membrane protein-like protein [Ignicoccus hospitalis KIN4/I]HIH91056.1 DUF2208 domain-containing protein [Desulfurococcaceae archaeon]
MEGFAYGKKTLLISLLSTTAFAAVLSFFPQYYVYLILAYFVIMPIIMVKFMSKQIKEMRAPGSGKTLMEEDAKELFDKDPQGDIILKAQMKQNALGMVPFLILIALAFTLWPAILHLEEPWLRFIAIFAYFESYTLLNYFLNKYNLKNMKKVPRPVYQYKVTDKGIQIKPFGGITFPLKGYSIKLVKESSAVDLVSKEDGKPSYRLYAKEPERLYDVLRRLGGVEEA